MKRLLSVLAIPALLLLASSVSLAQPVISGVTFTEIASTGVYVTFNTSVIVDKPLIRYGLAPATPPFPWNTLVRNSNGVNATSFGIPLEGLAPSTTYAYQVCAVTQGTALEGCSTPSTFTTAAALPEPLIDPTLPDEFVPGNPPTVTGNTYNVAADCSDLAAKISTAAAQPNSLVHEVVIPNSANCAVHGIGLPFGAHTGYIWIHPQDMTKIPPPGVRIDPALWTSNIPTLRLNVVAGRYDITNGIFRGSLSDHYWITGLNLTIDPVYTYPGFFAICDASNTTPIVLTTCTPHGMTAGQLVQTGNILGNTAANGKSWKILAVPSPTQITLKNSAGNGAWTSGGFVYQNGVSFAPAFGFSDSDPSSYIVIDRVIWKPYQWPWRASGFIYWGRCHYCAVINSYSESQAWEAVDPDGTGTVVQATDTPVGVDSYFGGADHITHENNYFGTVGISVFADNSGPTLTDVVIRRNHFKWDPTKRTGAENLTYYCRQALELKRGGPVLVEGNIFEQIWTCGDTGSTPAAVIFTPRWAAGGVASTPHDLTFRYNTIKNSMGGVQILGSNDTILMTPTFRNVLFKNNLIYNLDGTYATGWVSKYLGSYAGSYSGYAWDARFAFRNFRIENNTIGPNFGSGPHLFLWDGSNYGGGVVIQNNIGVIQSQGGNIGDGFTNLGTTGVVPVPPLSYLTNAPYAAFRSLFVQSPGTPDPTSSFTNNAWIPGTNTPASSTSMDLPGWSKTFCDSYWAGFPNYVCLGSGSQTANQRIAMVKYANLSREDYHLRYDSPFQSGLSSNSFCVSNPGLCLHGSDGRALGADIDALEASQGKVKNVRVRRLTSTSATVSYTAPDSFACTVEYGTSPAYGTGTRTVDAGGARPRNVFISGLTTHTLYNARVLCAAEQPTISFTTN